MKSRNPPHVELSNRETIVAFSHDRGVLKSNSFGDYFVARLTTAFVAVPRTSSGNSSTWAFAPASA
jgi:hypothetical protein